jgi:hypothetical protein
MLKLSESQTVRRLPSGFLMGLSFASLPVASIWQVHEILYGEAGDRRNRWPAFMELPKIENIEFSTYPSPV